MTGKYRVNEIVKFNYSDIGEYIDENHTDRPLRNDEVVERLNVLNDENEQLKKSIKRQQDSNNECAKLIEEQQKENEKLKVRINTFIEGNKTLQARLKEVSTENKNSINKILQTYYDMNKEIDTDCQLVVLDMIKCIAMEMGVELE